LVTKYGYNKKTPKKGVKGMKRFVIGLIAGFLLATTIGAAASSNIRLVINGKEIIPDVPPQIIDGRVMVPARFIAEPLGATVKWDELNNTVIIASRTSSPATQISNDWESHTSSMLSRTKTIASEFQRSDKNNTEALIKIVKKFNPIIQDANAYIPPTNKIEAYRLLIDYIAATHRHYHELTEYYINQELYNISNNPNNVIESIGCMERANFYKERADSMLAGFLKYR